MRVSTKREARVVPAEKTADYVVGIIEGVCNAAGAVVGGSRRRELHGVDAECGAMIGRASGITRKRCMRTSQLLQACIPLPGESEEREREELQRSRVPAAAASSTEGPRPHLPEAFAVCTAARPPCTETSPPPPRPPAPPNTASNNNNTHAATRFVRCKTCST